METQTIHSEHFVEEKKMLKSHTPPVLLICDYIIVNRYWKFQKKGPQKKNDPYNSKRKAGT